MACLARRGKTLYEQGLASFSMVRVRHSFLRNDPEEGILVVLVDLHLKARPLKQGEAGGLFMVAEANGRPKPLSQPTVRLAGPKPTNTPFRLQPLRLGWSRVPCSSAGMWVIE
jgi:hypothetical protein